MSNPTLTQELVAIAKQAEAAPHGQRGLVYQEAAARLGMSERTLHNKLDAVMLKKERKRRKDHGTSIIPIEELRLISAMMMDSQRKRDKQLLSIEDSVEILIANNEILGGTVNEATGEIKPYSMSAISRALYANKLHPKQLLTASPSVQLASKHPNHVWEIDASISAQFYLDEMKGAQAMDKAVFYEGKPQNLEKIKRKRLWRYVITDHASGAIYLEYVLGAESAENICNCLINAMQKRAGNPFHGVPFMIMTDPGAAMTSATFRNLCNALGVDLIINKVGNARAKGQVEQAHNIVERKFEGALKLKPVHNLAELNKLAEQWSFYFNATKTHSRHGKTRNSVWLIIKPEQLRIAPDVKQCQSLAISAPIKCSVDQNLNIKFKGAKYYVGDIPTILVEDKLEVTVNPWAKGESVQVILVNEEGRKYFHIAPRNDKNELGFSSAYSATIGSSYRSVAETVIEKNKKQLEQMITGTSSEEEAKAARKAKKVPFEGRINPFKPMTDTVLPTFIPKQGTELKTTIDLPKHEEKKLSHVDMALRLKNILGKWSSTEMELIKNWYPDGVPETELNTVAERIKNRTRLSVVVGG